MYVSSRHKYDEAFNNRIKEKEEAKLFKKIESRRKRINVVTSIFKLLFLTIIFKVALPIFFPKNVLFANITIIRSCLFSLVLFAILFFIKKYRSYRRKKLYDVFY